MLAAARLAPDWYYEAMQEDRATEWMTAAFFAAAAAIGGVRAVRARRPMDGLVALFCIVAAGEEISWGQRLLGFTPPDVFLARNVQQEANLHNMVEAFGQPKWTLVAILVAYGVAAPLAVRYVPRLARLADRLGFAAPPLQLVPWFLATIAVEIVYPVQFTGEWAEAIAGALFVASLRPSSRTLAMVIVGCVAVAILLERVVARPGDLGSAAAACARAEAAGLARALEADPWLAERPRARFHRRIWSLVEDQDAERAVLDSLAGVPCAGDRSAASRRRAYGVDPWGTAYWTRVAPADGARRIEVYSFGPNRRRDPEGGDDIRAVIE